MSEYDIIPVEEFEEDPQKWDKDSLPLPLVCMCSQENKTLLIRPHVEGENKKRRPKESISKRELIPEEYMSGPNDVRGLVMWFDNNVLGASKRIGSAATRINYRRSVKQFIVWCNQINFDLRNVRKTLDLRNLNIMYNYVLAKLYIRKNKQEDEWKHNNTVAVKMQAVRKFWEGRNAQEQTLDIRGAFGPEWITTQNQEAFKLQKRIPDELYNEIVAFIMNPDQKFSDGKSVTKSDWWILFLLAHGCRRMEVAGAKIRDINTMEKEISIIQKGGTIKKLPLPDWFTGIHEFEKEQVYVVRSFGYRSNVKVPVSKNYIYERVQLWLDNTSFKGKIEITPHSFRRYMVNSLQKKGVSDSNIAKLSGHKSLNMLQRYGYDLNINDNPAVRDKLIKYDTRIPLSSTGDISQTKI